MTFDYQIAAIPTLYRGRQYRSRLEAKWAAFFDLAGLILNKIMVPAARASSRKRHWLSKVQNHPKRRQIAPKKSFWSCLGVRFRACCCIRDK